MPILRAELEGLVAAGATFIQIDEPSPAIHPDAPSDFAALFNAAVAPVAGRVRLGAHLCFGNYLGRPLARRTYRPVLDAMLRFDVDELVLEFANREMAEVEILGEIAAAGRDVAAGVIDVKNYHLESADEVAERIEPVLAAGVPPGAPDPRPRLRVQPDRPMGDDAPSFAPWSPAATWCSATCPDTTDGGGTHGRPRGSRCSAPGSSATSTRTPCTASAAATGSGSSTRGARSAARHSANAGASPSPTTDLAAAVNHPDTDVVVVALPNFLHEEAVGLAAAAGKAVLCTKPLGRTAEEARRMLDDGRVGRRLRRLSRGPVLHAQDAQGHRVGRRPGRSAT